MSTDTISTTRLKKGKASYIYSILGVALVLFLIGVLGWVVINASMLSSVFKENVEISIILNDNTREENAKKLKEIIDQQLFTKSSQYISKDVAAQQFAKECGEEFLKVLDYNPLYTSINFHVKANYMNKDSLYKIEQFILQSNIVREVFYVKNLVDIMNSNVKRIGIVLLVISIILIFSVIFLIDNTIRLAMYSNRFLIKTMQMVGATRWFIAKPFNIRSIINGIISAALAIIGILFVKTFAEKWIPGLSTLATGKWITILCISILTLGICISLLSTHRSVIKYLRTQLDELY